MPSANTGFHAGQFGHHNLLPIDPSIADAVSYSAMRNIQGNHVPGPVQSNYVAPGPLAEQTGYGLQNNRWFGGQTLNNHQLNGYMNAANGAMYGQNTFTGTQASGYNQFNTPMTGSSHATSVNNFAANNGINNGINTFAPNNGINNGPFSNLAARETNHLDTNYHSLLNANPMAIGQTHSEPQMEIQGHTKSQPAAHPFGNGALTADHTNVHTQLPGNHDAITSDANNALDIHTSPEHSMIASEVHHFVADSSGNELHEVNNLPLQFFSQGHQVATAGDHASLEADHAIVEAGLSEDHPDHHILDSLNEHHHGEGSVEHIMPAVKAIHVNEDSHGNEHKHYSDWHESEQEGPHDVHVQDNHHQHPYAIHVSDNGHGYAVQSEGYHDHGDGHVEHVMDSDMNHMIDFDHADHIVSDHGINDHEIVDHEIGDHGIGDHGISDHGSTDHLISDNTIDGDHSVMVHESDHATVDMGHSDHHEIIDHGISDHGISDHGIIDHGIGEHEIIDHGIGEHDIFDHGIGDHGIINHDIGDHGIGDLGIGDHESIDHGVDYNHGVVEHEIHDPGIHVNFHAIEHDTHFHDGIDGLEHNGHDVVHDDSSLHLLEHGHNEVGITDGESFAGHHETSHVVPEHLHEEPHVELHHDDHRDIHDGGITPEVVEANIHSNTVPEYNGNNPMTDIHDVTGHVHDVRHDINDGAGHDAMHAGTHDTMHDGIHDIIHSEAHHSVAAPTGEFTLPGHAEDHANYGGHPPEMQATSFDNQGAIHTTSHDLGVHGFDEHGTEFMINREGGHPEDHDTLHAQKDDINLADHAEENQVHLDEKDAELLKKAKDNEVVDPPYLVHVDPHGDGFGEGVVGGPDLNVGNDMHAGAAAVSSTFPAMIPNSPPFVGNHPATLVHDGNIMPDYGTKRQHFENAKGNHVKSGYVSIGTPKQPNEMSNNVAAKLTSSTKTESMKPKLSKFINGDKQETLSFFANDREGKEEQTFETIPNEPRIAFKTVPNEENRREGPQDSAKITTNGVDKEQEHNMTNGASSNIGGNEKNETKAENAEKEIQGDAEKQNNTDIADGKTKESDKQFGTVEMSDGAKDGTNNTNNGTENITGANGEKNETSASQGAANVANDGQETKSADNDKEKNDKKEGEVNLTNENNKMYTEAKTVNETKVETAAEGENEQNGNETKTSDTTGQKVKSQSITATAKTIQKDQNAKNGQSSLSGKEILKKKATAMETKNKKKIEKPKDIKNAKPNNGSKNKGESGKLKSKKEPVKNKEKSDEKSQNKENKSIKDGKKSESKTEKKKKEENVKTSKKDEKKTEDASKHVENSNARELASGSGEGSGEAELSMQKEKKLNDKSDNQDANESNKENEGKSKEENAKSEKEEEVEKEKDSEKKKKTKENLKNGKQSKEQKSDKMGFKNEKIKGTNQKLNKSKAKGKKEEGKKNDNDNNGDLGTEKATGGDAENNPGGTTKEQVKENNPASHATVKNNTKSSVGDLHLPRDDREKKQNFMTDNSTSVPGAKSEGKQDTTPQSNEQNKTKTDNYGLYGGPGDVNSYTEVKKETDKVENSNDEIQKVDKEGQNMERKNEDKKGEKTAKESTDENGFEKVGPQGEDSSDSETKDEVKESKEPEKEEMKDENQNISVDQEEWKSSEDKNEKKETTSGESDTDQINNKKEDTESIPITIEESDITQETGPTETPTQFYVQDSNDGSGLVKTPTETVSTQPDAFQISTEKSRHELDGVAKSEAEYIGENDDVKGYNKMKTLDSGETDPLEVIQSNTAMVQKGGTEDDKDILEAEATKESSNNEADPTSSASYSNLEEKSKVGEGKATIRKRNEQPRYGHDKMKNKKKWIRSKAKVLNKMRNRRDVGTNEIYLMNTERMKLNEMKIRRRKRAITLRNMLLKYISTYGHTFSNKI